MLFATHFKGCSIVGADISKDLLDQAKETFRKSNKTADFVEASFDKPIPFPDSYFDLVSCNFAIYYAEDISFSIKEMYRVLKPNGTLLLVGPAPTNKTEFFDLQQEITDNPTPFMPGRMRFEPEALPVCRNLFSFVEYRIFTNPVVFNNPEPFVEYVHSSVTEDRLLWRSLFPNQSTVSTFCKQIEEKVSDIINDQGSFTMTKVVGGIIGIK